AARPDAIAVAQGNNHLSYAALNGRGNQLARCLWDLGVRPETRVAVLLERTIDLVMAELAILKCGAAYLPLDWNAPVERQAFIIKDCQAGLTLAVRDAEISENIASRRVNIDSLTLGEYDANNLALPLVSETPAYVIYTSGSTGQPKGVVVPHRAIGRLTL